VKDAKIQELKELESRLSALTHAQNLIYYDGVTLAPSKSEAARGETLAVLAGESHHLLTLPSSVDLVENLSRMELDAQTAREVKELKKEQDRSLRIPVEELMEWSRLTTRAEDVWHTAKLENDWPAFRPLLEKLLTMSKQMAGYYDADKDPYDVWLWENEEGLTRKQADPFFDTLKKEIPTLLQRVQEAPQPDTSFLKAACPLPAQKKLTGYLMDLLTIDPGYCVAGESEHPFTVEMNRQDVRITTHYYEDNMASSMMSVIHEGGHALYEMHISPALDRTCLTGGVSMGIHESQSRFYENIIGRSRPFAGVILPRLKELFPQVYENVTEEALWRALNKAEASLIRIEADELSYGIHILVRYELEKALFSGDLAVADLPGAWGELYQKYLGITVPDDARGVLQDTHWSGGSFGYFPSYAIGSAYGAQMLACMQKEMDVWAFVREGNLAPIGEYLREKVWRFGRTKTPKEIMDGFGGFDPQYYISYLKEKFEELYRL